MASLDRREGFARHVQLLALVLEALVVLALLSGAFPFALASPIWYLRLSDAAVGLAPALLLAVILLRLANVLVDSDSELAWSTRRRGAQLAQRWAIAFALLVPLKLLGFGWLWIDSERQLDARLSQAESQRAALVSSLQASGSEAELLQRLSQAPAGGFPPPPPSLLRASASLADQKQQLSEATSGALTTLKANLRDERTSMLRNSFPGSLRGLIGAAIVSAFLFGVIQSSGESASPWTARPPR